MKTTLLSLILLLAILAFTYLNALKVESIADKLLAMEESFPEKSQEKNPPHKNLLLAEDFWEREQKVLLLTVHTRYISSISQSLGYILDYYQNGSESDYLAARSQLVLALNSLKTADSLSMLSFI